MKSTKIYKKLAWFNELPADEAEYVLLECHPSPEWARFLAAERPFSMLTPFLERAESIFLTIHDQSSNSYEPTWIEVERKIGKLLER